MMGWWTLALISWAGMAVIMAALWVVQNRGGKAALVDVVWAAGVGIIGVLFAYHGEGFAPRRLLVGALVGLWSARLTSALLRRTLAMPEDGRYLRMVDHWGPSAQRNLFVFFQVQALWSVLFALPCLVAAADATPGLGWRDFVGVGWGILAIFGEAVADRQLASFRNDPTTRGGVCQVGLWRWSRHPNYFFEWLFWFGFVFLGIGAPLGWLTFAGPAVMFLFLFRITGIPYTEKQALASRGEAYREYQRTTNAFFPGPPRRSET